MNAIVQQLELQHIIMPLVHKARYVVMINESQVITPVRQEQVESFLETQHDHDYHQLVLQRSFGPCHVIKALTDNVDPYDYECCDSDDEYSSNSSIEETSCSSGSLCNSDEDSDSFNDLEQKHNRTKVSFCTPLVTACYVRPVTTPEEKYELYYSDIDYREFRRNYIIFTRSNNGVSMEQSQNQGRLYQRRKNTLVQFHAEVVTNIHIIPNNDDHPSSDLYYSRSELQGFLDDFVASLSSKRI